jgi:transposase
VALETTGGAEAIAGILRPHVARVVVVNTKKLRAISEAKAKTDRLDARRLAELLASGYLAKVWCPDERTRALRRWVARRAQLVRQRPSSYMSQREPTSGRPLPVCRTTFASARTGAT